MTNPYADTRATMDAVHDSMKSWAERIIGRLGESDLPVRTTFPDDPDESALVLLPYRLTLWPKLVENASPVSLLGANPRAAAQAGVPEAWMRVAIQLTQALREVFPRAKNKAGVEVVMPNAPLSSLPKPLADWYDAQPVEPTDGEPAWIVMRDGEKCGRLPTMSWMPGIKLRVHYLAQMAGELGRSGAAGVVSALTVGLHLDRSVEVERPPAPLDPTYFDLMRAIAASAPSPLGPAMAKDVETIASSAVHTLPVLPHEAPQSDDFAEIMRTLRRPLAPTLLLQLQIPVAGHPQVLPAVSPQFSTNRMPEPGDVGEDEEDGAQ